MDLAGWLNDSIDWRDLVTTLTVAIIIALFVWGWRLREARLTAAKQPGIDAEKSAAELVECDFPRCTRRTPRSDMQPVIANGVRQRWCPEHPRVIPSILAKEPPEDGDAK